MEGKKINLIIESELVCENRTSAGERAILSRTSIDFIVDIHASSFGRRLWRILAEVQHTHSPLRWNILGRVMTCGVRCSEKRIADEEAPCALQRVLSSRAASSVACEAEEPGANSRLAA